MTRLLITGGHGFLGSAVKREFEQNSPHLSQVHTFRSSEYDLRKRDAIKALLSDKKPEVVVHLAATVGGIGANMKYPGTFLYDNLIMGAELIEQCRIFGIKKFVLAGTICSYPKFAAVPFKEDEIWLGYPEETNAPYGLAKKILTVQLNAYKKQYGFNGITLLPVNLYGPGDNFDLESSHVIPAMMRKMDAAKRAAQESVTLWGDGSPSREFLYVDDAARAIRLATERYDASDPVNLGSGSEITMKKLAELIARTVEFEGQIIWDSSKPNGQPRRSLDVSRAKQFGFTANVTLPMGLQLTYQWYLDNFAKLQELFMSSGKGEQPRTSK
ncbi:MAG: GDP-L-fucose synthase [Deltaproteobacteria bacterium]|nr:GDP-L-fucose synthase [Deltaproteobacteria bacterium]